MNRGTRDTICATIGLLIVIALLTPVAALDSPGEMDEPNALSSAAPEPRVEMPEDSLPAEEYAYCNDVCLGLFELTAHAQPVAARMTVLPPPALWPLRDVPLQSIRPLFPTAQASK